jgi:hypothetical protein
MKSIRFSITDEEERIINHEAKSRGLTKSQFAKSITFNFINKYLSKGILAELYIVPSERRKLPDTELPKRIDKVT